jgi:hypothetical protein
MFEAKYNGVCATCGHTIYAGQMIRHTDDGYEHVICKTTSSVDLQPNEVVCTECFMVKPCECDDL